MPAPCHDERSRPFGAYPPGNNARYKVGHDRPPRRRAGVDAHRSWHRRSAPPVGGSAAAGADIGRPQGVIDDRLDQLGPDTGAIFDGYPRTEAQAHALDDLLDRRNRKLDHVIELEVDEEALVDRITGRYTCARCGAGAPFGRRRIGGDESGNRVRRLGRRGHSPLPRRHGESDISRAVPETCRRSAAFGRGPKAGATPFEMDARTFRFGYHHRRCLGLA